MRTHGRVLNYLSQSGYDYKEAMQKAGVKSYISDGGVKVTLVPDGEDTTEWKFNEKAFKKAHEDLYEEFTEPKLKKGRAGYVLITLPKEK